MAMLIQAPYVSQRKLCECWYACLQMVVWSKGVMGPRRGDPAVWQTNNGITNDQMRDVAAKEGLVQVYDRTNPFPSNPPGFTIGTIENHLRDLGPLLVGGTFCKATVPYQFLPAWAKGIASRGKRVGDHCVVIVGTTNDDNLILHDPWSGPNVSMSMRGFNKNFDWSDRINMLYYPG